jgi:hypothetical protein
LHPKGGEPLVNANMCTAQSKSRPICCTAAKWLLGVKGSPQQK